MKSWEQQEGESDTAFAHFLAFLTLGVGRSIPRAYRATHPDTESTAVSGSWRDESVRWGWRRRANDFDLSTFRETIRESVAIHGESIRHLGLKALDALSSEKPEMRPANWEQALDAFAVIRSLFTPDIILSIANASETQGDPPPDPKVVSQDVDEDGFLMELPEDGSGAECERLEREKWGAEQDKVRTGEIPIYRREVYAPPEPPTPPAG